MLFVIKLQLCVLCFQCVVISDVVLSVSADVRQPAEESSITKWSSATSDRDELLYSVYKHFWEQGYFLTSGGKFGGDFLVYPGLFANNSLISNLHCCPLRKDIPG